MFMNFFSFSVHKVFIMKIYTSAIDLGVLLKKLLEKEFSQYQLIFFTAGFFVLFHNNIFFTKTQSVYNGLSNIPFILSLAIVLFSLCIVLLTLFSSKFTTKFLLIFSLTTSSLCVYFMNTYNVIIDSSMIQNIVQTNVSEASELFNIKEIFYLFFLGLIPSYFIYKSKIIYKPFSKEIFSKVKVLGFFILVIIITILAFSKYYTSFFRENKALRYYTNPTYWIYSAGNYINKTFSKDLPFKTIAQDAKIVKKTKRKLMILVVGEAARADHFSLNNYNRKTNPLLEKEKLINFSNMTSCGTSTAVSVPCMFSIYSKDEYTYKKGISTENALDILYKTNKVDILWKDNNSDSKGVALRVPYKNIKSSDSCQGECRDEKMLENLDSYIKDSKKENILIVLHQMGNHGPAYYQRYPKEFEKFIPVCKTNQLEQCSKKEITNAYDNALLYTDYFLSKTIDFLKPYKNDFDTGMIYLSDHGQSLGENGIYLHGMPYLLAPKAQTHIPAFMWFENSTSIDTLKLEKKKDDVLSQDYLFNSLLSLFDVQSQVYDKSKDIFANTKY